MTTVYLSTSGGLSQSGPGTFSDVDIGTAADDRIVDLVVVLSDSDPGATPSTFVTISIGGVEADVVSGTSVVDTTLGLAVEIVQYTALVPSGTMADIIVSGIASDSLNAVVAYSLYGCELPAAASNNTSATTTLTLDHNSASDSAGIGGALTVDSPLPTHTWSGATEGTDFDLGGTGVFALSIANFVGTTTESPRSVSVVASNSSLGINIGNIAVFPVSGGDDERSGAADIALQDTSLSATGAVALTGSASVTLDDALLVATGRGPGGVSSTAYFGGSISSFSISRVAISAPLAVGASSDIAADLAVTLDDVGVASSGELTLAAQAEIALDGVTLSATGELPLSGTLSATIDDVSLSATGAVAISGTEASVLDDVSLNATGSLSLSGELSVTLDEVDLHAVGQKVSTAQVNVTLDDVGLFADSTLRLPQTGAWAPSGKGKPKKKSRREQERLLDQALAKAFEPKRGPKRPIPEPWLAEPVIAPDPLAVPDFNPRLAGLSDYVLDLQRQLAQRKFELSQIDADDELLLLSL